MSTDTRIDELKVYARGMVNFCEAKQDEAGASKWRAMANSLSTLQLTFTTMREALDDATTRANSAEAQLAEIARIAAKPARTHG